MATTPSIKIVKAITFRGVARTFSNRYHFTGGTPADAAHWTTLADSIVTSEKAIYRAADVTITEAIGYAAGSDVPVFTKAYTTAGTGAFTSFGVTPGDVAALVRYATTARTSKNHPVYLFNYYHAAGYATVGPFPDNLNADQSAAMATYATHWITGFSDGALTLVRSGPNGATAVSRIVETFLTHRDFPR